MSGTFYSHLHTIWLETVPDTFVFPLTPLFSPIGSPFDSLQPSDFDVGIVSRKLLMRAKELNIPTRGIGGTRSVPLRLGNLNALGLDGLLDDMFGTLYNSNGRMINFVIYDSLDAALNGRGPTLRIPGT